MDKTKVEQLRHLLAKAETQGGEAIRKEAKEFLQTVNLEELVQAEQMIIDEGISSEKMRHLCSAHIEMMKDNLDNLLNKLPKYHPLETLMLEHKEILSFLDGLEAINKKIQSYKHLNELKDTDLEKLANIAHHLEAAEKHHAREEDVLFPAIEEKGISGPPAIMREEHTVLRQAKKELAELAESDKTDFNKFKDKLDQTAKYLVFNLREHIFKEDNILYPAAYDAITSKKQWEQIKDACDKIGYCCFSPEYLKK